MRVPYTSLYFGMSDSYNEATDELDNFLKSYVDLDNIAEHLKDGRKFLVLGPKGSGKSALACYLKALSGDGYLAAVCDAAQLPLAEIPHLHTGQQPGPDRTVSAWKFILLCNYLELLLADQSCSVNQDPEIVRVAGLLRDFGFMGDAQGRALTKLSKTTIKIPIPTLGELYSREKSNEINVYTLLPYLESWVCRATASNRQVLLVDGLDSVFLNDRHYDASLSSMVQAAYALNQALKRSQASGSVVLLMRNDIFSRISLSLPDSQKMRDDLAYELDWRVLAGPGGRRAPLMKLVNAKAAKVADRDSVDVLGYFPKTILVGSRRPYKEIDTFQYLLNMTRHTPRDLLRIFEEIRKIQSRLAGSDQTNFTLTQDVIREGVLQYATKYFVGAISNEFAGFDGGPEAGRHAVDTLKRIGGESFTRDDFDVARTKVESVSDVTTEQLLRLLFFAGAIGNVFENGSQRYLQFFHRRDDSDVYTSGTLQLHHALVHAWNVVRRRSNISGDGASNGRTRVRRLRGAIVEGTSQDVAQAGSDSANSD